MLTFSFTGVDGTMTECETLTSGMVGKQVQILFDSSWDNLSKTVVFRAADVNRVVIDPESSLVTIPEAVLARPFGKLFVGVCGTDESGTVVIPTVMAEGPMIRYGADPIEDETASQLPVWENLQNQIGDLTTLETTQAESLTDAVNELHRREARLESDTEQMQETLSYLGEPMLLETDDKASLVGAVNELHRQERVLASDVAQIQQVLPGLGDPAQLETAEKTTLVGAVNEIHQLETALESDVAQIQQVLPGLGDPALLETAEKTTLVGAVNELHGELEELAQSCIGLTATTAQLLIDILSKGTYTEPQEEAIAALAAQWGVTVPKPEVQPILYWDFRTTGLTDQITGAAATKSTNVTLDEEGAHLVSQSSFIMLPASLDGSNLSGHTMEVKFGQMTLSTSASSMRIACSCLGSQPATSGVIWTTSDCWSAKSAVVTEFTDINMFSGKTLYAVGAPDSNRIDWYCEDQLICSTEPTSVHSHMSIGSSNGSAYPAVVEYVKIYPNS